MKGSFLDLNQLVRSIQRAEGNPDCFGRSNGFCDRTECAWRPYCLGGREKEPEGGLGPGGDSMNAQPFDGPGGEKT